MSFYKYQDDNSYLLRRSWVAAMRQGVRFTCGICLETIYKHDKRGIITVDHIVPRSKGGSEDFTNMQPAHQSCNRKKSNNKQPLNFRIVR